MLRISKRAFLATVSLAVLTFVLPAQALLHGTAPPFISYVGNPNVTITAVNTGGGIVLSRSSGQTPAFVQVSASAITATGTSVPFEDLAFRWNFGDPTGTEVFTNPVTGGQVNANSDQFGPEAAYCYRSAGTYTITLYIQGKNGSGFTNATVATTFAVTAFSASGGDFYFDQTAGSDGTGTIGSPYNTLAHLNTIASAGGTNLRFNLKRGSHWSGATEHIQVIIGAVAGCRIQPYGSGADPIIEMTSGSLVAVLVYNGSGSPANKSDWVFSNLVCKVTATAAGSPFIIASINNATGTLADFYLDNCTSYTGTSVDNSATGITFQFNANTSTGLFDKSGVWGGSINSIAGDATLKHGFFGGAVNWNFIVGLTNVNGNGSPTFDHHFYTETQKHLLTRWVNFAEGGNRNYCVNTNWDSIPDRAVYSLAQYVCFDGNNFTGTQISYDAGNANNDPTVNTFQDFVVQNCAFHGLKFSFWILFSCATSMTVRDCNVWSAINAVWFDPQTPLASLMIARLYRNKLFQGAVAGNNALVYFSQLATWTQPQQITDNIIQDNRATANIEQFIVTDVMGAGSIVDRNQYYAPNDASNPVSAWTDNTTIKTFAQWKALNAGLDPNSTYANPNWPDPANGIFA